MLLSSLVTSLTLTLDDVSKLARTHQNSQWARKIARPIIGKNHRLFSGEKDMGIHLCFTTCCASHLSHYKKDSMLGNNR